MKKLINLTTPWMPLAVAIICIYGITYLAIQQYIRLSANEILMQYAIDTKERLENGKPLSQTIKGIDSTDMEKSLSPFIIIYNNDGRAQASTTTLHGKCPSPPMGVFNVAQSTGENRRSWQPEPGVRNAIVVIPYSTAGQKGYVVAGRSLREVEMRESFLLSQITVGLMLTLAATFIASLIAQFIRNKVNKSYS